MLVGGGAGDAFQDKELGSDEYEALVHRRPLGLDDGILGGLQAYGVMGIFIGPVLLATIVAFLKIYREEYAR